jgi:hypothetical protein
MNPRCWRESYHLKLKAQVFGAPRLRTVSIDVLEVLSHSFEAITVTSANSMLDAMPYAFRCDKHGAFSSLSRRATLAVSAARLTPDRIAA